MAVQAALYRRTPCKFFAQGHCERGEHCTWSHDFVSEGQQLPPVNGAGAHRGGAAVFNIDSQIGGGGFRQQPEQTFSAPPSVKKTLCKFFLAGTCEKGKECTWAHGYDELGELLEEPAAPAAPAPATAALDVNEILREADLEAEGRAAWEQLVSGGLDQTNAPSLHEDLSSAAATEPQAPPAMGEVKRTLCKFFEAGSCKNGELCTWAHGESELGMPMPLIAAPEPPFAVVSGAGLAKRTICKFWQQGQCMQGENCSWAHGDEELSSVQPSFSALTPAARSVEGPQSQYGGSSPSHRPNGDFQGGCTMRTNCKFWEQGRCTKGDSCTFLHGEDPVQLWRERFSQGGSLSSGKATLEKRTLCKFWLEGSCARGSQCTWAHGNEDISADAAPAAWVSPAVPPAVRALAAPTTAVRRGSSPKGGVPAWMASSGEARPNYSAAVDEDAPVRRSICNLWQQGHCQEEKGQCMFAHGAWELNTRVGTIGSRGWQGKSAFSAGQDFKRQRVF